MFVQGPDADKCPYSSEKHENISRPLAAKGCSQLLIESLYDHIIFTNVVTMKLHKKAFKLLASLKKTAARHEEATP